MSPDDWEFRTLHDLVGAAHWEVARHAGDPTSNRPALHAELLRRAQVLAAEGDRLRAEHVAGHTAADRRLLEWLAVEFGTLLDLIGRIQADDR